MADITINDSMAEMYLYETNSLLEQLDQILLGAEKSNEFSKEEIDSIFRIMHTIKGSSAMMEFSGIAKVAHKVEDLFSYIRNNGIDRDLNEDLCNLVFQANDFLKEEVEKVEGGEPLNTDIAFLEESITRFLGVLKGETPVAPASAPAETGAAPPQAEQAEQAEAVDPGEVVIYFDEGCQMENVRAMIILNKIREIGLRCVSKPERLDNSEEAVQEIVARGFRVKIDDHSALDKVTELLRGTLNIASFTVGGREYRLTRQREASAVRVFFEDGCEMENMRAFQLLSQVAEVYPDIRSVPAQLMNNEDAVQQIIHEGFLLVVAEPNRVGEVLAVVEQGLHVKSYATEEWEEPAAEDVDLPGGEDAAPAVALAKASEAGEPAADLPARSARPEAAPAQVAPVQAAPDGGGRVVKQNLISVSLNKLDALMELVGEIVITESMVTSSPDLQGVELENFTKSARQLRKLTGELQDISMSLRMVPVSGTFQKMFRIVRDMNKKLDKDVELILVGEETEVDKTIVDSIADPLMHLVRNSMDHGIESREERLAAGKPAKGKIVLSAQNSAGEILITVQDDGKGLDRDALLNKAAERGLLTKNPAEYSEKEAFLLLLLPGFSTKSEVTEFSGRGVGMDVVKKNIEKIGGAVSIESKKGLGMATIFKIPLTLAIIDAMKVAVGKSILSIPINVINQTFKCTAQNVIEDANGTQMVLIRNECYPIIRLYDVFDLETQVTEIEEGILILVEAGGSAACVFADELLGQYQVVVKPLPSYLSSYDLRDDGIVGCTILGDGSISLILEMASLLR
ncbi:MAG: chemotaxis protein CheA [Gracilibacteraceae bacterium]|jgi:two-component system chemotaxis sensor kinase CheA|nr:chemotaxis protein CheA [Gracilibacteraceae bacterium]